MADIWNLNALCRCCHKDGYFRSMQYPYVGKHGDVEVYQSWLKEVFGIMMVNPSVQASVMICEECITSLRDGRKFKQQVTDCELRFQQYCQNEANVKVETGESSQLKCKLLQGFHFIDSDFPKKAEDNGIKIELETENEEDGNTDNNDADHFDNNFDSNSDVEPLTVMKEKDRKGKKKVSNVKQKVTATKRITREKKASAPMTRAKPKINKAENQAETASTSAKHVKLAAKTRRKINKQIHIPEKPQKEKVDSCYFACKICGHYNKDIRALKLHMATHRGKPELSEISCQFCDAKIDGVYKYKVHIKKIHPGKGTVCKYCPKIFSTPGYELRKHVQERHQPKDKYNKYICDYCNNVYRDKTVIRAHISCVHMKSRLATCPMCARDFSDNYLKHHIAQVHQKLRAYRCKSCPKTYKTKKALIIHTRKLHTNERPYVCEHCGAGFVNRPALTRHVIKIHRDGTEDGRKQNSRNLHCFMCKESFQSRGAYRKHLYKQHDGMMPHQCHICAKSYASIYVLNRHILSHEHFDNSPAKFKCEICLKIFKNELYLNAHQNRTHGPKNRDGTRRVPKTEYVKCDTCNKMVQHLGKHKVRHTDRPFKCHLCERSYSMKTGLRRHINDSHLNKFNYSCDICGMKFIRANSVPRHKTRKHPEVHNEMKTEVNAANRLESVSGSGHLQGVTKRWIKPKGGDSAHDSEQLSL